MGNLQSLSSRNRHIHLELSVEDIQEVIRRWKARFTNSRFLSFPDKLCELIETSESGHGGGLHNLQLVPRSSAFDMCREQQSGSVVIRELVIDRDINCDVGRGNESRASNADSEVDTCIKQHIETTHYSGSIGNKQDDSGSVVSDDIESCIILKLEATEEKVQEVQSKSTDIESAEHYDERSFECNKCDRKFICFSNLETHLKSHSRDAPFRCNICRKQFKRKGNLKIHQKVHSCEKPYKCNLCLKRFDQLTTLKMHKVTHSIENYYKCKDCNKFFNNNRKLTMHMKTHSNERPYSCNICMKGFRQPYDLKRHKRIHSNKRAYVCDVCQRGFKDVRNLIKHIRILKHVRTHSSIRAYKCDICDKVFKHNNNLLIHIKSHNG